MYTSKKYNVYIRKNKMHTSEKTKCIHQKKQNAYIRKNKMHTSEKKMYNIRKILKLYNIYED